MQIFKFVINQMQTKDVTCLFYKQYAESTERLNQSLSLQLSKCHELLKLLTEDNAKYQSQFQCIYNQNLLIKHQIVIKDQQLEHMNTNLLQELRSHQQQQATFQMATMANQQSYQQRIQDMCQRMVRTEELAQQYAEQILQNNQNITHLQQSLQMNKLELIKIKQTYQSQIQRLKQQLHCKDQQYQELQRELDTITQQKNVIQHAQCECTREFNRINNDNLKLNNQLVAKVAIIKQLQQTNQQLQQQLTVAQQTLSQREQQILMMKHNQNESSMLTHKLKQQEVEKKQLYKSINIMQSNIQILKSRLKVSKSVEPVETYRSNTTDYNSDYMDLVKENNELIENGAKLQTQLNHLLDSVRTLQSENIRWRTQATHYEQQLNDKIRIIANHRTPNDLEKHNSHTSSSAHLKGSNVHWTKMQEKMNKLKQEHSNLKHNFSFSKLRF